MSGFKVNFSVNNQLATPSIHAAALANRPAAGQPGRVFIDTDNPSTGIYRDTGTAWVQVASTSSPEVDTLQTVTDRGNTTTQSVTINSSNAPQFPLDVYGDTDIINVHATNGNDGVILFSKAGSHRWRAGNYHGGGNDYFSIYNMQENSDGILVNLSTNNVAIGGHTTSPTYKLDIAGSLANTGNAYLSTSGTGVGIKTTTLSTNAVLTVGAYAAGTDGKITIKGRTNDNNWLGRIELSNETGSFLYQIYGNSNGMFFDISGVVGMQLTRTTRNLLLNTSVDNGQKLQVNGTARITSDANINGLTVGKGNGSVATNTALGTSALNAVSGNHNTGIGASALSLTSTGTQNTAVGTYALINNSTASNQTAFGYDALSSATTSGNNTAVGNRAGKSTTGASNIFFGDRAGYDVTTGTFNTIIGSVVTAGTGNGITTGSYNTIIGSQITGLSSSLSNTIILADGQGNQRLYIDNTGQVGIGTTSPSASAILDVSSTTKGFLPPRMTTTEKNAIANTAGLVVFDTTLAKLCVNSGAGWETITSV